MNDAEQRAAAKAFAQFWKGKGNEKSQSQQFWTNLLRDVYGVQKPEEYIAFEEKVQLDHKSFIDGLINATHVMIEQKSIDKDLRAPIKQSDGTLLTPIEQAKRYSDNLPYSLRPRWIITCNFKSFLIYDMERPHDAPDEILLESLPNEYYRMNFLVNVQDDSTKKELEVSKQAGILIGKIYDALLAQYTDKDTHATYESLNKLCVRLVFCLYAEDAGIFGKHGMFAEYMRNAGYKKARSAIIELFHTLDRKIEERDKYLDEDLAAFPYVNGGLFSDEDITIPQFTEEIVNLLTNEAGGNFDWRGISPTIFGAIFESTLSAKTRRSGGMHYTSIENIHKIIDPLFLDDLKIEFAKIKEISEPKQRNKELRVFQRKLASLHFFDPACGSGNFLTETYISLRRLENEVLRLLHAQVMMGFDTDGVVRVSIGQFYGIEVNDFAVTVAKTALWIAESQMLKETEDIILTAIPFLPLKTYTNIVEGNALQIDWQTVVSASKLNYIMGNPPFIGKKYQDRSQKADMVHVFGSKYKGVGNLDYVTAWYKKAVDYMQGTNIETAFVSTNSIVQGEHIPLLWENLIIQQNVNIIFGYKSFVWDSESSDKAAVHCVIIGFKIGKTQRQKWLYASKDSIRKAENIHPYMIDMPNIFIENRSTPLFASPSLVYGSFALDGGGNYTISESEYNSLIEKEPDITKYLKLFIGSEEFINGINRYCIWLKGADMREVQKSKILRERITNVQEWRSKSGRKETVAAAETPTLFAEIRQPDSDYMAIPITSSERRKYIPIGYMTKDVIASNHLLVLPNATLFEFGVLMSNVHMGWMRTVAGRLKSDYNYSARIVYNNFPWCCPTDEQKKEIERSAQAILDARALYPQYTLATMYDPRYTPPELVKAHQNNDRAVLRAYGFDTNGARFTEVDCVARLMELYAAKANQKA